MNPLLVSLLLGVMPGHMFGGMDSATVALSGASLVVLGAVTRITPHADGTATVALKVLALPCGGQGPKVGRAMDVVELGDHRAGLEKGQLVLLPLHRAADSPHRPPTLAADAWVLEQGPQEVVVLEKAQVKEAGALAARLCKVGPGRLDALLLALASPFHRLASGATRELMTLVTPGMPGPDGKKAILQLLGDATRPLGYRVAAVHVAARSGDPALEAAAVRCVSGKEPPELVAGAVRSLGNRPQVLDAALVAGLGTPGPGRAMVVRAVVSKKLAAAVPGLVALSQDGLDGAAACAALASLKASGVPEVPTPAACPR